MPLCLLTSPWGQGLSPVGNKSCSMMDSGWGPLANGQTSCFYFWEVSVTKTEPGTWGLPKEEERFRWGKPTCLRGRRAVGHRHAHCPQTGKLDTGRFSDG